MNESEDDSLFFLGAGPIAAVVLGMMLIPLREWTTASNLTFVFLALIIGVAELGGRWPALATAISSALSLNFFLTQPYLTLTIHSRDDIVAFFGLALCGAIAASFGARGRRMGALSNARKELGLLHATARQLELSGPLEPRLTELLESSISVLPLSAIVVRDRQGHVLAAADGRGGSKPAPGAVLDLGARKGAALPAEGCRVALVAANSQVGWLDIWGNGRRASVSALQTLGDLARMISVLVAEAPP
ncbi:MAG TPA: DUF4118 domain-containing protein [Vicinamibacteria bacterium]|jgi:two-component system sensor histidine kinase KdpD